MKTFLWILGLGALGCAAYIVYSNGPSGMYPRPTGATDHVDQVGKWGSKQRVTGIGNQKSKRVSAS